jgi:hypothetical protein
MSHHAHVAYLCVVARASLHQVFHCDWSLLALTSVSLSLHRPPDRSAARPRCSPLLCAAQGLRTTTRKMKTTMSSWRQPTSSAPYKRECRHRLLSARHFRNHGNVFTHPRRCLIGHRQRVRCRCRCRMWWLWQWLSFLSLLLLLVWLVLLFFSCVVAAATAATSVVGACVGWW